MKAVNSFAAIFIASLLGLCSVVNISAQTVPPLKTTVAAVDSSKEERYRIGFQDTLEVSVYTVLNILKFQISPKVAADGTIRMPDVAEPISVVCKTERELAYEIADKYSKRLRNPFVNVRVVDQRSQWFSVIGAVNKPDTFYTARRTRLLQLLSQAGGPDTEKAGTKLIVARTGNSGTCRENQTTESVSNENIAYFQFDIKDVLQGKKDLMMEPGDIVSVLDADYVYVYGNVNKQGSIKLTRPITLRQAIASSEGFAPASKKDKIRVLRQKEGSADWDELIYNLKDIDSNKAQDPILMPNDIIAVSEDKVKSIVGSIGRSLTNGVGGAFYRIP